MAAIGYMGANHQNASVAGQTGNGEHIAHQIQVAPVAVEHGLSGLFSGGTHPELIPQAFTVPVDALAHATDSVRGPLGGMISRLGSTTGPGPSSPHPIGPALPSPQPWGGVPAGTPTPGGPGLPQWLRGIVNQFFRGGQRG